LARCKRGLNEDLDIQPTASLLGGQTCADRRHAARGWIERVDDVQHTERFKLYCHAPDE
jgi:hypothetical protein